MTLSVITASYNNADTIENCIQSVIEQNYTQIEYIIIDGQSSDGSIEIINKFKEHISLFVSEPDTGIYDALNKGIQKASGDYIGFLHADDFFASPTVISKLAEKLSKTQADVVYGDLQYISKNNTHKVVRNWKSGTFSPRKLRFGWMPPHPTMFIKKVCYQKYGLYDTKFKIAADYDMILRLLSGSDLSVTYQPVVITKMRTGGASNKNIKNILDKTKEDYKALKKNDFGDILTLIFKNLRKLGQFLSKQNI